VACKERHGAIQRQGGVADQKGVRQTARGGQIDRVRGKPIGDPVDEKLGQGREIRFDDKVLVENGVDALQDGKECEFQGTFHDGAFVAHGVTEVVFREFSPVELKSK